jgi:hypothetical protein
MKHEILKKLIVELLEKVDLDTLDFIYKLLLRELDK